MNIDFSRIIQEVAVNLQQPLMDKVEDACRISWDTLEMQIYSHNDDGEDMVITVIDIADLPSSAREKVSHLMLQANYLWIASDYATLCVNPETDKISLCDKIPAALVNAEMLTERVKSLYKTAMHWQEIVANESQGEAFQKETENNGMAQDFAIKV